MEIFIKNFKKILMPLGILLVIFLPILLRPGYVLLPDFVWGPYAHPEKAYGILSVVYYLQKIFINVFPVVGINNGLVQKTFLSGIFTIIFYGGYQFAYSIIKNNFPHQLYQYYTALIMGIFAISNPWVYDRMMYGQVMVLLGYGFLLIMVVNIYRLIYERHEKFLYRAIFFYVLSVASSLHYSIIAGIPLLIVVIIWVRERYFQDKNIKISIMSVLLLGVGVIVTVFLGYSIIHNTSIGKFASSIQVSDVYVFSPPQNISPDKVFLNTVSLSGFWGSTSGRYMNIAQSSETRSLFFILVLVAWYGFWIKDRTKYHIIKKIGLLVTMVLSIGLSVPLIQSVNYFLFTHIPLYTGLRETTKWQVWIIIFYIIGLLFTTSTLLEIYKKYQKLVIVGLLLVVTFSTSLTWWGYHHQIVPQKYPAAFYELFQHAPCQPSGEMTIVFPWHMYQQFGFSNGMVINHPGQWMTSCNNIITGTNMEFGGIYDNSGDRYGSQVSEWVRGTSSELPKYVKYIIILHEVDFKDYQEKIANLKNIRKIFENTYGEVYIID